MADRFERCLVIGAGGFIGQNMLRCLESRRLVVTPAYRDTPLEELSASEFDCVFFCAGNSKTYLTNREPVTCRLAPRKCNFTPDSLMGRNERTVLQVPL